MKLKNEALEKLYGTIVNSTITISPFADSPVDEAFKECDRELANLQNRNDILEKSNGTLLDANFDLCSKNRDLKNRIRHLEKDLNDAKNQLKCFTQSRDDWRSRAKHEAEEKNEQVKRADNLAVQVNKVLGEKFQLQKEIEQLKKDLDALLSRTHCAEDEVEQLKKDRDIWVRNNGEKQAEIADLKRKLEAREEELDAWTRKHLEATTQIDELKKKLDEANEEITSRVNDTINNKTGYEQGQTDLWEALQNVNDINVEEFDVECHSTNDVVSMDLEDFLDAYKKWQDQKETDHMREWLLDFCNGRVCEGCPLEESKEYKCGCGYSFRKTNPYDLRIIPDEDIKRYYEKARGCGRYTMKDAKLFATTVEGVNRAITKACEGFCEAVRDADTKITENLRKGCTFEAEINVNKDLFEKLCGMKSEEEKPNPKGLVITTRGVTTANYTEATMNAIKEAVRRFEKSLPALDSWESTITGSIKVDDILGKANDPDHKFEYGDAVRLPWRDYDYMYIDADKNHIRLFNPKTHTVVLISPSEKLTYQGCKIVICDEDDLRKIWKDKK